VIKGLEILYRTSQLGLTIPKLCPKVAQFDAVWGSGLQSKRERAILEHALEKFVEHLPASLKSVQQTVTGKSVNNTIGTLVRCTILLQL
jgi:hypothetical protein